MYRCSLRRIRPTWIEFEMDTFARIQVTNLSNTVVQSDVARRNVGLYGGAFQIGQKMRPTLRYQ